MLSAPRGRHSQGSIVETRQAGTTGRRGEARRHLLKEMRVFVQREMGDIASLHLLGRALHADCPARDVPIPSEEGLDICWRLGRGCMRLCDVPGSLVAVASCRRSADAGPEDLYPDPDAGPLQKALAALGVRSVLVAWDDPSAKWASFSHVLVSSTWDSVDRSTDYLRWVHQVAEVTRLVNPPDVIEWGLDKVHQKELAVAGLPVIPTTWLSPGDKWPDPPAAPFVVKPSVSAGARSTALYRPGDHAATGHVWALQEAGQTVMVQEYIPAVDQDGETDLAYFKGHFSHAVRKKAMLRPGEGVLERPWERMEWTGLVTPNQAQVAVADSVVEFLVGRFGQAPTYCRVDLVRGPGKGP